jgi:hypothetical protein
MTDPNPPENGVTTFVQSLGPHILTVENVHLNVAQELIATTEDKVSLCLHRHLNAVEQRHAWVGPLGICVALVLCLVTASFRNFILPKATWQAIFVILAVASLVWLTVSAWRASKAPSIEDVVARLKASSPNSSMSDL